MVVVPGGTEEDVVVLGEGVEVDVADVDDVVTDNWPADVPSHAAAIRITATKRPVLLTDPVWSPGASMTSRDDR